MSWYFFGGFSAYWIEPSGRMTNQSGCSATQGWSGEHWKAMSSASSIPRLRVAATSELKSRRVPSSGAIDLWPPSFEPMAHGLPGSSGVQLTLLLRPLRNAVPIGWIGGGEG